MSKFDKKCSKCRNYNGNILICESCTHYKPKLTVFDHITQSVEALAEKLVYMRVVSWDDEINWYSVVLRSYCFRTKEAAIAATIVELKKEVKDE